MLFGEVDQKLLEEHEYFGEASIVRGTPRSADVEAVTQVRLMVIGRAGYMRLIAGTDIAERMTRLAANRADDRVLVGELLPDARKRRWVAAVAR